MTATFWNGEAAEAFRCKVIVPNWARPQWMTVDDGPLREAVVVRYNGRQFFLDNLDGSAWRKVTDGKGSPHYGHRSLPDACAISTGSNYEPAAAPDITEAP